MALRLIVIAIAISFDVDFAKAQVSCSYTTYTNRYCDSLAGVYTLGSSSLAACQTRCNGQGSSCVAFTYYASFGSAGDRRCYLEDTGCSLKSSGSGGVVSIKTTCTTTTTVLQLLLSHTDCSYTTHAGKYCNSLVGDYSAGSSSLAACKSRCNAQGSSCTAVTYYSAYQGVASARRCYLEDAGCSLRSSSSGGTVHIKTTCKMATSITTTTTTAAAATRRMTTTTKTTSMTTTTKTTTMTTASVTTLLAQSSCSYTIHAGKYCGSLVGDYSTGSSSLSACRTRCNLQGSSCVAFTYYSAYDGVASDRRCYVEDTQCSVAISSFGGLAYIKNCPTSSLTSTSTTRTGTVTKITTRRFRSASASKSANDGAPVGIIVGIVGIFVFCLISVCLCWRCFHSRPSSQHCTSAVPAPDATLPVTVTPSVEAPSKTIHVVVPPEQPVPAVSPPLAAQPKKCICGNTFMDDSAFCRKCGKKRSEEEADSTKAVDASTLPTSIAEPPATEPPTALHDTILPPGTVARGSPLAAPATWKNNDLTSDFCVITELPDSVQMLQEMISSTFKKIKTRDRKDKLPSQLIVQTVERVENSKLWRDYANARATIKAKRPHKCTSIQTRSRVLTMEKQHLGLISFDSGVNEVFLWHGTSPAAAAAIAEEGFNIDMAGSATGTMYGNGIYLAECSSKSDEYAKQDVEGLMPECHCLMLCRVVLGESLTMGPGGASVHDTIAAAMRSGQFESVVGDREASVGTYREFVVFTRAQVYPEYIVMYKRE